MVHYRGLLLIAVFSVLLLTFFLQAGEARRTDIRRDSGVTKEKTSLPSVKTESPQQGKTPLDGSRVVALRSLYEQMKSGAPVSDLEAALLQRFNDGDDITFVEADTVISRALYDFYVRGIKFSDLRTDQQSLLEQYKAETAMQPRRIDRTNGAPLPQLVGTIAPGLTSAPMDVFFTNSTPGASSTLRLDGTHSGGTFASTKRVTIP